MRKNHRGQRPESDEPLSAGRVEYLEQARARVRARRLRRTALIVAVLTAVVLFTTGLVGSSVALVKDCVDTTRIALMPGPGWPQQTGVMEPARVLPMTGGFVELGGDSTWIHLPEIGIRGNTHAMMQEDNSRQIADLVCDWLKSHVK